MRYRKANEMVVGNEVINKAGKLVKILEREYGELAIDDLFTVLVDGEEKVLTYMALYSLLFNPRKLPKYKLTRPFGETIHVRSKGKAMQIIMADMNINQYRAKQILESNDSYIFEEA